VAIIKAERLGRGIATSLALLAMTGPAHQVRPPRVELAIGCRSRMNWTECPMPPRRGRVGREGSAGWIQRVPCDRKNQHLAEVTLR